MSQTPPLSNPVASMQIRSALRGAGHDDLADEMIYHDGIILWPRVLNDEERETVRLVAAPFLPAIEVDWP